MMRTPVFLLLDSMLSQDVAGLQSALQTMRNELPPAVTAAYLQPSQHEPYYPIDVSTIIQHLSVYLQTFPHQAATASANDGSLPLHFAASFGDVVVAQVVWQAHTAAAWTPNAKGKIPLHYAAREGKTPVVHFLLQVAPQTAAMASGKDKLALHFAAGEGHLDVVVALLRCYPQGAYLPSAKGKLPLHFCSRWGHEAVAMELLRYYPDAIRALDWEGSLPLHEACREGQASMARLLLEQLPEALATANLRNEVPLFPAVRVNSLELVMDLLQAWPAGARHVLQHVVEDDRIATWTPALVEALLRATVECWDGFAPWQNRPPAIVRLHAQVNHVLPEVEDDDDIDNYEQKAKNKKEKKKNKDKKNKNEKKDKPKKEKEVELGTIEDRKPRLWTAGPFTSIRVERIASPSETSSDASRTARVKSPILDHDDTTILRPRKRARNNTDQRHANSENGAEDNETDSPTAVMYSTGQVEVFSPLRAALIARASLPVLQHVLELYPDALTDVRDGDGMSLFHLALKHHKLVKDEKENGGVDWIFEHLYRPALVTERATSNQTLPLHIALQSRASSRIINALLKAHPSSGIEPCQTRDEWQDETPLSLACENGCDYSTVFLLLRADPSVVKGQSPATRVSA
mmetsp:Transcript_7899/g.15311  ORF Transcript_7899/g.15311 Transcript_7899/m.15311 type:complete len:633 (-) Transcript_7899:86-1984(-)